MDNATPPLNALKIFDAVVRFGSMKKAASELRIAPSSVTQHIRNLEDHLGGDLFDRTANAIALNERGRAYAASILGAFDTIHKATSEMSEEIRKTPLRISCVPTLAGPWLARHLAAIEEEFPGQEIRCAFSPTLADFASDEVDLAIRYGSGDYIGATAELLYTDVLAPVCTPETAKRLRDPQDLGDCLRLDSVESAPSGLSIWRHWAMQAAGQAVEERVAAKSPWIVQSSAFAIETLQALPCVAILERAIVQRSLEQGSLVAPFDMWVPAPYGYYIVSPNRRTLQPPAKRLKALLKRSVEDHFHPSE